jgi:hypothetical protein
MRHLTFVAAGLALLAATLRAPPRQTNRSELNPLVLRPAVARTLGKAMLPLLLDAYWLRTLNAIGLADSAEKNRALYEYGAVLTELDPRFYTAYTYIGLNIPYQKARNVWVNADLAGRLLEAGARQFPDDLRMNLYLGFNRFHFERRFKEASAVFLRLSTIPGAPDFAAPLAARLLSHDGEAREALALTEELLASTTDDDSRAELEQRRAELLIEVVLQDVDEQIEAYAARHGRRPTSVGELRADGVVVPMVDPAGGAIRIDESGKASSTSLDRRVELYE